MPLYELRFYVLVQFFENWKNRIAKFLTIRPSAKADCENVSAVVNSCCCSREENVVAPSFAKKNIAKKSVRSISSMLMSLVIAFFPKCPVCWAAYMSMFGSFSLARLPYQAWLYPVMIGFLGLHLWLIFRRRHEKGPGPFLLSLLGAAVILLARAFGAEANFPFIIGMLCILSGSLWNSFSYTTRLSGVQTTISNS